MQIDDKHLKNESGITEVIAKKIIKDRKKTPSQRMKEIFLPLIAMWSIITCLCIFAFLEDTSKISPLVIAICLVALLILIINRARRLSKKGSRFAGEEYDWVNKYDNDDEAFNVQFEKGRDAYEDRLLLDPEEKKRVRKELIKIVAKYFPIYIVFIGGITILIKYTSDADILGQVLYGIGVGVLYFLAIFVLVVSGAYYTFHEHVSQKYDKYVEFYLNHKE